MGCLFSCCFPDCDKSEYERVLNIKSVEYSPLLKLYKVYCWNTTDVFVIDQANYDLRKKELAENQTISIKTSVCTKRIRMLNGKKIIHQYPISSNSTNTVNTNINGPVNANINGDGLNGLDGLDLSESAPLISRDKQY